MHLNKSQRFIILVGIVLIVLMGLFPPWIHTSALRPGQYSEEPAGYKFIASPPARRGDHFGYGVKLDVFRLGAQLVLTIAVMGLGFLLVANRSKQ